MLNLIPTIGLDALLNINLVAALKIEQRARRDRDDKRALFKIGHHLSLSL